MDWMSFAIGALIGAFTVASMMLLLGLRWLRPFYRQAIKNSKANSAQSMQPPINWKKVQEKWDDGGNEGWKP